MPAGDFTARKTRGERVLLTLAGLIFTALTAALLYVGADTVRTRHFAGEWKARGPGYARHGTVILDGGSAVRAGVGITTGGLLLGLWTVVGAVSVLRGQGAKASGLDTSVARVRHALSLVLLLTAYCSLVWMWQVSAMVSGAMILLINGMLFLTPASMDKKVMGRMVFPVLVIVATVAGRWSNQIPLGIVLGIFAGFGLAAHLLLLSPRLREKSGMRADGSAGTVQR